MHGSPVLRTALLPVALALLSPVKGQVDEQPIPDFRTDVLTHLAVLAHGAWEDWSMLLEATAVLEGSFRLVDPGELQSRPNEYLDAVVDSPRVLLGHLLRALGRSF
jgi:hypothetical protein